MPFKMLLSNLVDRLPSAQGAILTDWEGEAVEQASRIDDYRLKLIGAHKGVILDSVRRALKRLDWDEVEELIITTEKRQTLVMPINHEYFLVVALDRDDVLGKVLLEVRTCVSRLKAEIC